MPMAGKMYTLLPWPGTKLPAVDLDRREGTSARENGAAARPAVGLLRRAFRARGRIGVRKNNRALVGFRHRFDHLAGEEVLSGASADDGGRPDRPPRPHQSWCPPHRLHHTVF